MPLFSKYPKDHFVKQYKDPPLNGVGALARECKKRLEVEADLRCTLHHFHATVEASRPLSGDEIGYGSDYALEYVLDLFHLVELMHSKHDGTPADCLNFVPWKLKAVRQALERLEALHQKETLTSDANAEQGDLAK